jgi:cytochrome P450
VTVREGLYASVVVGYEDARSLIADPRLSKDPRRAPRDWQEAGRGRPLEDRAGLGTHLLTTDPPEHTRLRRLIASAFSLRRVERLRDRVQRHAHELIDGFEDRPEVDLITGYAFPLPVTVLCELLGVPSADQHTFSRWTSDILSSRHRSADARPVALRDLHGYVTELIRAKRSSPGDDLTSALVTGHDKDGDLSETELISMLFLLLVTGHETTVNLIGNGVLAFLRHPDQRELLRARPDLLARAVEEVLRYDSPVTMSTWRFTTEPMEIAGTEVPAGDPSSSPWPVPTAIPATSPIPTVSTSPPTGPRT